MLNRNNPNSAGNSPVVNRKFVGGKPTMFICGNEATPSHTIVDTEGSLNFANSGDGTLTQPKIGSSISTPKRIQFSFLLQI